MIETLESRTLLTGVLSPAGVLTVNGLPGFANDNILVSNVSLLGTQLVRVQHFNHVPVESQLFPASRVRQIVINGFGGADQLRLMPNVAKPAVLNGHDGNDILVGGAAGDRLLGGNGRDLLSGAGGNDSL